MNDFKLELPPYASTSQSSSVYLHVVQPHIFSEDFEGV